MVHFCDHRASVRGTSLKSRAQWIARDYEQRRGVDALSLDLRAIRCLSTTSPRRPPSQATGLQHEVVGWDRRNCPSDSLIFVAPQNATPAFQQVSTHSAGLGQRTAEQLPS